MPKRIAPCGLLGEVRFDHPNRPAAARAAYIAFTRTGFDAPTAIHALLLFERHALPPDLRDHIEQMRDGIGAMLANDRGDAALALLDTPTLEHAQIESMLAALAPPRPAATPLRPKFPQKPERPNPQKSVSRPASPRLCRSSRPAPAPLNSVCRRLQPSGPAYVCEKMQHRKPPSGSARTPLTAAVAAARAAHLHYTNDTEPGFTRHPHRGGFLYRAADGTRIRDADTLNRIRKLVIPPAHTDVWICQKPNGHIQAIGRDARGRKQYRYHPEWRAIRDESKYGKMLVFGRKLPEIRAQVERDIARPGLPREKIIAALVRLLERTLMRIGNEEYARANKSFGLTTLRRRHAKVKGSAVIFDFRAKHGIAWHAELKDRRLANIIRRLQDIKGQDLFKYIDDEGHEHGIGSDDVNAYLRDITGEDITAKDFRTWAATNLAAIALQAFEACDTEAKAKKNVLRAVESVAKSLGNTPSICRKCYIHPAIFQGYLDGSLLEGIKARAAGVLHPDAPGLTAEERAVMAYLDHRLSA